MFVGPDMYLGEKMHKTRAWAISPIKNVFEAVRKYEDHLEGNCVGRLRLLKRADNPFKMGNDQGLYMSPEFEPDAASYLQKIVVLR